MKKFTLLFISLILSICSLGFIGCKNTSTLENSLSELRYALYEGQVDDYLLKASYGFKESEYSNDGKVGKKIYLLSFSLLGKETDDKTYYITFEHDGKCFEGQFKLSPTRHVLTCQFEIDDFNEQSFSAKVGLIDDKKDVAFNSVIPKGTLSYKQALDCLEKKQSSLLENYKDSDGNFNAEIYQRIIVKDGKAYWYIGIANGNGRLKALLIDGKTGEVLATREVF